jgi:hypothetical protein
MQKPGIRKMPGFQERVKGIEPSPKAWEAFVLPLNYTRAATGEAIIAIGMGQGTDFYSALSGSSVNRQRGDDHKTSSSVTVSR